MATTADQSESVILEKTDSWAVEDLTGACMLNPPDADGFQYKKTLVLAPSVQKNYLPMLG